MVSAVTKRIISSVVFSVIALAVIALLPLSVFAEKVETPAEAVSATESTEPTEPTATAEPTTVNVITGDFPALTVNAISNYFPKVSTEYNYTTDEITITYWLRSGLPVLSTQWYMTYDAAVLGFSEEKNTPETICPLTGGAAVISREGEDTIRFNATDIRLLDFTADLTPFAVFVFDVTELYPEDAVMSKVDLTVDVLCVSPRDPQTGLSDPTGEVWVISNSDEIDSKADEAVRITTKTTLSPSNFALATTAPPTEPPTGIDADGNPYYINTPDEATTAPISTAPVVPTKPDDNKDKPNDKPRKENYLLPTGSLAYALICFGVITACASALFIMRKRELY